MEITLSLKSSRWGGWANKIFQYQSTGPWNSRTNNQFITHLVLSSFGNARWGGAKNLTPKTKTKTCVMLYNDVVSNKTWKEGIFPINLVCCAWLVPKSYSFLSTKSVSIHSVCQKKIFTINCAVASDKTVVLHSQLKIIKS